MAKLEVPEETKKRIEQTGSADVLIAIAAPVHADDLGTAARTAVQGLFERNRTGATYSIPGLRVVVAYPNTGGLVDMAPGPAETGYEETGGSLHFLPYSLPSAAPSPIPLIGHSSTYRTIFGVARELDASACVVLGYDLAALRATALSALLAPVLDRLCDLAMPVYPQGKFEGLLNSSILFPLTRSLYGRRVRFPLAPDFVVSGELLPQLEQQPHRNPSDAEQLFWPATEATLREGRICQVNIDVHHNAPTEGIDLSTVLTETVGPLFAEMEASAPVWQRVRSSHPLENLGTPARERGDAATVDVRPMLETFQLGFRNLQEVWSLVLPPVTLLDLKRLTRQPADQFRVPDELWARIIYDFALAHRLRTLGRGHLLGALTPLYLGWVTSYVLEVGAAGPGEAELRIERLARAFEETKPYLLSRWRWPDRFNP